MSDAFGILLLLSFGMIPISLLRPDLGLRFAIPEKRTKLRGGFFWLLMLILSFFLFGITLEDGTPTPPSAKIFTVLSAACVLTALLTLRNPSPYRTEERREEDA